MSFAVLFIATPFLATGASAQNYEHIAPNEPPAPAPKEALPVPPVSKPAPSSDQVIVKALKGLVFVSGPDKVKADGLDTQGIDLGRIEMLGRPGFREKVEPFMGKPLTFAGLNDLTHAVVDFYRDNDHPLVNVAVPEQDVDNGTIQIIVDEYRVGKVVAEGNEWFSSDVLTSYISEKPGDTVIGSRLLDEINALNENPFREVDLVYRPGTEVGTSDLVLSTRDRLPLRAFVGYDDSGAPATGRDRWNIGFNWGNALWLDQQVSYQLTTSDDFWHNREQLPGTPDKPALVAQSLSWVIPLPWRDRITIFGSYEESSPRLGPDLGLLGKSGQASIRYDHPLPHTETFEQTVQLGFDFKTTNNNLAFGGVSVSQNQTEIDQFLLAYTATLGDTMGSTTLTATLVGSPGGLTGDNNTAAFQPGPAQSGRASATANYVYQRVEVNRATKLPYDGVWAVRFIGQHADGPLLDTEQLGGGGADILRGYDERAINGDQGILFSTELRTPPMKLLDYGPGDQLQLLTFFDYGSLYNKDVVAGDPNSYQAASTGLGMGYTYGPYFTLKLAYGWQLRNLPGQTEHGQFGHLSVTVSY